MISCRIKRGLAFFLISSAVLFSPVRVVNAQVCYPARTIDQWACLVLTSCPQENQYRACAANPSRSCAVAADCNATAIYPVGQGPCATFCSSWETGSECKQTENFSVSCSGPPSCSWSGSLTTCDIQSASGSCTTGTTTLTYGCWGPGSTPTTAPGGPTPVPPPCPNGQCDIAENCANCAADCGVCSTASVQARAVTVGADISCTAVAASANFLDGTSFSLSPAVSPASQTQSGGSYVSWASVPVSDPINGSLYMLSAVPPSVDNVVKNVCYTKTGAAPYTQGSSAMILPAETVTWNVGYGPPGPWVQTGGGDVYAAGSIRSLIPAAVSPRQFNLVGTGSFPGIVTYGASGLNAYDFDISASNQGETLVSGKNWLVNESFSARDFYTYYLAKFGGSPTSPDYENLTSSTPPRNNRGSPCPIQGDLRSQMLPAAGLARPTSTPMTSLAKHAYPTDACNGLAAPPHDGRPSFFTTET